MACEQTAILRWSTQGDPLKHCWRSYEGYHYRCQEHRFEVRLPSLIEYLPGPLIASALPVPELAALPDVLRRQRRNTIRVWE